MAEQLARPGATVRIRVGVSYVSPPTTDVPVTFIVDLAAAAEFMGCASKAEDHLHCDPSAATPNNMFAEDEKRVTVTGILRSDCRLPG
jgi:hypothetical protein